MAFNLSSLRTDPQQLLEFKEYIDETVVFTIEKQEKQIQRLNDRLKTYEANKIRLLSQNSNLKFKLRDTEIQLFNAKSKLSGKEEEIVDLEKLRRELEELKKEVEDELAEIRKERQEDYEEMEKIRKENRRLNNKFKLNSTNSSIPSSQQGFREVKNSRVKTGRKVGGQKGHAGHFSKLSKEVDTIIEKRVKKIPTGAKAVYDKENNYLYHATQEIDLEYKTKTIEVRYFLDARQGKKLSQKEMDTYEINAVSYSNNFKAHTLYVANKGVIAVKRLCEMYHDMSDGEINLRPSTIKRWEKQFHKDAQPVIEEIKNKLLESNCLFVDETGWKTDGKKNWVQIMTSEKHALYFMVEKRGIDPLGVLPLLKEYKGALTHDHFKPYYRLTECIHVECNAHILRSLQQGIDLDNSQACHKMQKHLQKMLHERNKLIAKGITEFDDEVIETYTKEYRQILDNEIERYEKENPNIKHKSTEMDYIKLFRRMKEYEGAHLQFMHDFTVPFTNNDAERGIRKIKTHKKISTQSKTKDGAQALATVTSIVQTCNLQNTNSKEAIETILNKGVPKFID
ncbi:transposase IS66 family protein [Breznakia blatticola]|uniref:Transposase IS66 family protein n=1 Tax=Breznakia blatticola TaxID=1754012 RepID=A0A4R7ZGB6_9FIRM|nr:IS66 family transposase [Breznakia blatticola]TDW16723.1 transposase IS66 family protein [Breznakia blatticola]